MTTLPDWKASHDRTLSGTARGVLEYMLDFGDEDGTTLHELAQVSTVDPVGVIGQAIKDLWAAELIDKAGVDGRTRRTLWKPTDKAREKIA